MQAPAVTQNPTASAHAAKNLALLYWLSALLLGAIYFSTLIAVALQSDSNWLEAVLLPLAVVGTLVALARQLPSQNVLLAAAIIAGIGGGAHLLGAKTGIPFGSFWFDPEAGGKLFGILPWTIPLLWVVAVLNSRGMARLVLRPWRKIHAYGFWLIGLTALFTMLFDCALEPFATCKHYWLWTAGNVPLTSKGLPLADLVGWFIVTLLILAFVTPMLINKQLSKRSVPDFHPLTVWFGGILLFAVGSALNGLWIAVAADAIIAILAAIFAMRGARW
jgi:putative membrane protein